MLEVVQGREACELLVAFLDLNLGFAVFLRVVEIEPSSAQCAGAIRHLAAGPRLAAAGGGKSFQFYRLQKL
jgi:hypothetical protein